MPQYQAPMNDTGEDDMDPTESIRPSNMKDGEDDMEPRQGETPQENSQPITVPAKSKSLPKTNESLRILGAGQPYNCKHS